jgi:4-oxalocrotonate tautomerase family enzyme
MPVIQCDIREGRSAAQKQALGEAITRAVHESIGAPVEYIYVLIREVPAAQHFHGGSPLPEWRPGAEG